MLVPKVIKKKLVSYNIEVSFMVVSGRIKNFPIAFTGHSEDIAILPSSSLDKLVVRHYHDRYHRQVDTIVTNVRNDYWVLKCRKIASSIDRHCTICKLSRNDRVKQIMGDLPDFRTTIQPAFSVVGCDLWVPLLIKDEVVRRGPH